MGVRENIIKLRALSTLTQEDFGKLAGVTRSAVSQWEGGFSEPRMGNIERLAKHFGHSEELDYRGWRYGFGLPGQLWKADRKDARRQNHSF